MDRTKPRQVESELEMTRISFVLTIVAAALLATACQADQPREAPEEPQEAREELQEAQAEIEDLKGTERRLTEQIEQMQAHGVQVEALLRKWAVQTSAESCAIERVPHKRPDVRGVAFAYGEGPVFVGLGTGDGVILYTLDARQHKGWYYNKTLWAVAPSYTGEVVITGEQIDGPNRLRFNSNTGFPGKKQFQLRFPPSGSGWRYGPSSTLIRAPGCYVFSVRGDDFEQTITFMAIG